MASDVLALILDRDAICDAYTSFFVGVLTVLDVIFLSMDTAPDPVDDCCTNDEVIIMSFLLELAGMVVPFGVLTEAALAEAGLFGIALLDTNVVVFTGVLIPVFFVAGGMARSFSREVDDGVAVRGLLLASLVACCDNPLIRVSASERGETSVATPTLLLVLSVINEVGMRVNVDMVLFPGVDAAFCREYAAILEGDAIDPRLSLRVCRAREASWYGERGILDGVEEFGLETFLARRVLLIPCSVSCVVQSSSRA